MKLNHLLSVTIGVGILLVSFLGGAGAANAATADNTSQTSFTSRTCVAQVKAIAAKNGVSAAPATGLCSASITTTQSAVITATAAEARALAVQEGLNPSESEALVSAAAAGAISYRNWTNTYWGGSLVEKHAGRTYWDHSKAWIASYRGLAGSHTCHTEGGIAIGWAVTPISCARPGAGSSADAFYRFDASVGFRGSIITMNVGLHYSTSASGAVSAWVVGG